MKTTNRYYIDQRVGCMAVMDRTKVDANDRGLYSNTDGVVKYWSGEALSSKCPTCGQTRFGGYWIPEGCIAEAMELRDLMNKDFAKAAEERIT